MQGNLLTSLDPSQPQNMLQHGQQGLLLCYMSKLAPTPLLCMQYRHSTPILLCCHDPRNRVACGSQEVGEGVGAKNLAAKQKY